MKIKEIINIIDDFAPFSLAENWDNCGLLIGNKNEKVNSIITSLDVTNDVIDFAIAKNANLIVSHHPLLFSAIKEIGDDNGVGSLIIKSIKNDINIIAVHTNLDKSVNGLNQYLAEKLELINIKPLIPHVVTPYVKIIIYVPKDSAEMVRNAICDAGAGHIGHYSCCTFSSEGVGTFMPGDNTQPYIGTTGQLEKVNEVKIESIINRNNIENLLSVIKSVHPYEEVAYDIIPLANTIKTGGLGRIGKLKNAVKLADFAETVSELLKYNVNVCGDRDKIIKKVALCTGAGGDLWEKAVNADVDLYITGEVKHHQYLLAKQSDLAIIDAGHYPTEIFAAEILKTEIGKKTVNTDIFVASESLPFWQKK